MDLICFNFYLWALIFHYLYILTSALMWCSANNGCCVNHSEHPYAAHVKNKAAETAHCISACKFSVRHAKTSEREAEANWPAQRLIRKRSALILLGQVADALKGTRGGDDN
jgi:hypothetical protein